MKRIYFTITGTNHYYGMNFFEPNMTVRLVKEPDNQHDKEAIRVELEGLGKVGYVANSIYSVIGESFSAGRLYDRIGNTAEGLVMYKLRTGVLCRLIGDDAPSYGSEPIHAAAPINHTVDNNIPDILDDDDGDEDYSSDVQVIL